MADDREFEARIARVEALTGILERCPDPESRAASRELVGTLLDLHGEGLARLLALTAGAGDAGRALAAAFARDGLVANLLLLHSLHPDDQATRVRVALDGLGTRLGPHARVELVGLDGDVLRLKFAGGCGGCPSSSAATKKAVEDAVFASAPDLAAIEFDDSTTPAGHPSLPVITL